MPELSRKLVEHRFPVRPDKKPVKQLPRRFAPEIVQDQGGNRKAVE
ncbi:pol polyprotein, partial [Trifolium medium]|nr:pol polyprotein [Trifolium medium]